MDGRQQPFDPVNTSNFVNTWCWQTRPSDSAITYGQTIDAAASPVARHHEGATDVAALAFHHKTRSGRRPANQPVTFTPARRPDYQPSLST